MFRLISVPHVVTSTDVVSVHVSPTTPCSTPPWSSVLSLLVPLVLGRTVILVLKTVLEESCNGSRFEDRIGLFNLDTRFFQMFEVNDRLIKESSFTVNNRLLITCSQNRF